MVSIRNKILVSLAIISLICAGIYGLLPKSVDIESYVSTIGGTDDFELLTFSSSYNGYLYSIENGNGSSIGYVTVTEGYGYGGNTKVVINWSISGIIRDLYVPAHQDDTEWFDKLYRYEYLNQYINRAFSEPLVIGSDVDAVSGATVSSKGVAAAVQYGRKLVAEQLGEPYPIPESSISFGYPEILLLFGLGLVIIIRSVPVLRKIKWLRYLTLLYGLLVIGMWLTVPLSLVNFVTWLTGNPPDLATGLVVYILFFGILGLAIFNGKNYYCFWLCPFSAVQEVTHGIGRGGVKPSPSWNKILRNVRYFILWLAVLLVLIFSRPSLSTFEPWGTLFSQNGSVLDWMLLAFTLAASFFIFNIWCKYLCPVGAVLDITIKVRKKIASLWQKEEAT